MTGTGAPQGKAHCQRIIIASVPPTARNARPVKRNCLAMTLWSIVKTYFQMKLVGSGWIVLFHDYSLFHSQPQWAASSFSSYTRAEILEA